METMIQMPIGSDTAIVGGPSVFTRGSTRLQAASFLAPAGAAPIAATGIAPSGSTATG